MHRFNNRLNTDEERMSELLGQSDKNIQNETEDNLRVIENCG